MSKVCAFVADGNEEVELLTVVDLLRRADIDTTIVSITGKQEVTSSHQVVMKSDALFEDIDFSEYDLLFLPGGMPGTLNLGAHAGTVEQIKAFAKAGKRVAAVCAAPSVLGENGLLQGKKATCFPGFEDKLIGAEYVTDSVVTDGNITTSRGMGTCIDLGLELISLLQDKKTADEMGKKIQYYRS